ncbi:hypothetical protein ES703_87935 [subsurface metagenome]
MIQFRYTKSGHGFPAMILSISTKSVDFCVNAFCFMTVDSENSKNRRILLVLDFTSKVLVIVNG